MPAAVLNLILCRAVGNSELQFPTQVPRGCMCSVALPQRAVSIHQHLNGCDFLNTSE